MAGARAAASLSLTIAVAVATLAVVGGILAGPAVRACWGDAAHLGACLHGRLERGVLPPSPTPSSSPPPEIAVAPQRLGWIEANAKEYEVPPATAVTLSPAAGVVETGGSGLADAPAGGQAALAAPAGDVAATGSIAATALPTAAAELATRGGNLATGGNALPPPMPSAQVALAEPDGALSADGRAFAQASEAEADMAPFPAASEVGGAAGGGPVLAATAEPLVPAAALPMPALPHTTGTADSGAAARAVASLTAASAPVGPKPPTVDRAKADGSAPDGGATPPPKPILKAAPKPGPATAPNPKAHIKFNRRYPDVVVLPPPNSGKASSFSTLQLR